MKPELQAQLQEALALTDADFAYHASDLYVVAKPGVMEWLKAHYKHAANITGFTSPAGTGWNGAGCYCLDIPFAGKVKTRPTIGHMSFKVYACSRCGHEKEMQTNHWGECYSLGNYDTCPGCPPIDRPTVWQCQEKPPETHSVAEPWTIAKVN